MIMKDLLLHQLVAERTESFVAAPSHALMLVGPAGSGKRSLALAMAETLLGLSAGGFDTHPYALIISPEETGKAIGIEAIRKLEKFTSLRVPGDSANDRVVIIEDAQSLTLEAQNALLKTLEEPPAGTVLILTADHAQSVLPTIRSRSQVITVTRPDRAAVAEYFAGQGFDEDEISRNYSISGGLPGLMRAMLDESQDHPLVEATERARRLLSQSAFERLTMVDELAKQRRLAIDVTSILQQMAHLSLQTATGAAAKKWQAVLKAAYEAGEALSNKAQPKLALTRLMLSF